MRHVTIKDLLGRKFRLALTSIAVVLGVAFMAGSFVLTDTLGHVFDDLFETATKGVDAVVRAREQVAAPSNNGGGDELRPPVPEELADLVEQVPGVQRAAGNVLGYSLVIGKDGKEIQHQAPTFGTSWFPPREAVNQSLALVPDWNGRRSRAPSGPTDVALDRRTAEEGGFRIGDRVRISFLTVPQGTFTLTGVFEFGGEANGLAGATFAAFIPETAQEVLDRVGEWDTIEVRAESGVSQVELRDNIRAAIRDAGEDDVLQAITGQQLVDEQTSDIKENLSFFNTFLLVFAAIALFVGAFIIYNTFSITITQRVRELGLLRALGASGTQVIGSVTLEAAIVGLFSSVVGLVVGIGLVWPLEALLSAFNIDLPRGSLQILPRTVIVSIVVGTIITMVSAIAPARRAARIPPIAALREQPLAPSSGRRRTIWGSVLLVVGIVLLAMGLLGATGGANAALLVGLAAALVFVGVAMVSPLLVKPAARVLTAPGVRRGSITSRLARENAIRNPRRTASTAAALMVGLALVTLIAIFGESAKGSISSAIDEQTRADYILSPSAFLPFSPQAAEQVREELPGSRVVQLRMAYFEWQGDSHPAVGISPRFSDLLDLSLRDPVPRLRPDEVLVYKTLAKEEHLGRGDRVDVLFPTGQRSELTVRSVFDDKRVLPFGGGDFVISTTNWEERIGAPTDVTVLIRKPPGTSDAEAGRVVDRVAHRIGGIEADDKAAFKARTEQQFNQFLGLIYVLLLLAIVIALLGIANALALSIYERTREIGLLRAVGMSRVQLRRMIRGEARIVALFGSLLGMAVGLGFGRALVQALESEGIDFALPVAQLVGFLILAGLLGVLAAVYPARRAAKLDVLRAVQSE